MSRWDPRDAIAAKRDGRTLEAEEVERFVAGVAAGEVSDAQAAAFLMAALLRGLDDGETLAMTRAMIASGDTVTLPDVGAPTVDKHSTGGVADGVTLLFAPMAAAVGLAVAKLSGRGLGHTGGTLDKLESIPGLRTDLHPDEMARQVAQVGCAVAAQSARLVPADGALYALRDATATVPSIPLIAASVMSKKLAVRTDLILLDVKCGSGAFMRTERDARALAIDLSWPGRGRRPTVRRGRHRHVAAARGRDRERARRGRGGRRARGTDAGAAARSRRLLASPTRSSRSWRNHRTSRADERKRCSTTAARSNGSARWWRPRAGIHGSPTTRGPCSRWRRSGDPSPSTRRGRSPRSPRRPSGRSRPPSGRAGSAKATRSTPRWVSCSRSEIGDVVERGDVIGTVHARDAAAATTAADAVRGALTFAPPPVTAPPLVLDHLPAGPQTRG